MEIPSSHQYLSASQGSKKPVWRKNGGQFPKDSFSQRAYHDHRYPSKFAP